MYLKRNVGYGTLQCKKKDGMGTGKPLTFFTVYVELTLTSPYLIVDYEVQPFTPTTTNVSSINRKWNNQ